MLLHVIDASGAICRHGFGSTKMVRTDGQAVNAVNGVCEMLWRLVNRPPVPTHIAMAFDTARASSFRRKAYPDYKAHRPQMEEWLASQFDICRDACRAFDIMTLEEAESEADDVIATLAALAERDGFEVVIVSSDKDLMQLIRPGVTMLDPKTGKRLGDNECVEKTGVKPYQVADWLALCGDSVDNVPGVPKIGAKTAAALLQKFGTLDGIYNNIDQVTNAIQRTTLVDHRFLAYKSRELTGLVDAVSLGGASLEDLRYAGFDRDRICSFLERMELTTLGGEIAAGALAAA